MGFSSITSSAPMLGNDFSSSLSRPPESSPLSLCSRPPRKKVSTAWAKCQGHISLYVIHLEWLTGGRKSPRGEADLRERGERAEETGRVRAFRWQTVRDSSSPASPPDAKFNTANAALFFFPLFFFQCGLQGHCQKHIQHNQTSDGDSFPTACVSENSEIIPMF